MLKLDDIVVRKCNLDTVEMDGELVMMNLERGKYYGFNAVGSRIWEIIEKPTGIKAVIDTLLSEYDVTKEICEEMVLNFISGLNKEELISIV